MKNVVDNIKFKEKSLWEDIREKIDFPVILDIDEEVSTPVYFQVQEEVVDVVHMATTTSIGKGIWFI